MKRSVPKYFEGTGTMRILFVTSLLVALLTRCQSRPSLVLATPIFGNLGGKNDEKSQNAGKSGPPPKILPPPPPRAPPAPPEQQPKNNDERQFNKQQQQTKWAPPPPLQPPITTQTKENATALGGDPAKVTPENQALQDSSQEKELAMAQSEDGYWGAPPIYDQQQGFWGAPTPNYEGWMAQNQQPPPFYDIQRELDNSLAREHDLLAQVHNLTNSVSQMEQREGLHLRQLDVLTERVVEVENQAASEHSAILEYEANCTELGREVAIQQQELERWQNQCADFMKQNEQKEAKIAELKGSLKKRSLELEELAASIEKDRLRSERESGRKKQGRKSLFSMFIDWLAGNDEDDDDSEISLQEKAKSTLLSALQTERDNVEELESFVTSLQQNNSAISEMVQSRDLIIDELNDRVAVFEEDKVVLKAALRQLQKEMKEEAPKTQRLIDDLEHAREEISRLNSELETLIVEHEEEVEALQMTLSTKQSILNETVSNMTVIGKYVDKLEERLATFAITRRDLDLREEKCKSMEESVSLLEIERESMISKVATYEKEHEELRNLLEELADERSKLREVNSDLVDQKEALILEGNHVRNKTDSLEQDMETLGKEALQWKTKAESLQAELRDLEATTFSLRKEFEASVQEISGLKKEIENESDLKLELQKHLQRKEAELQELLKSQEAGLQQEQAQLKEQLDAQASQFSIEKLELQRQLDGQAIKFKEEKLDFEAKLESQAAEFLTTKNEFEKKLETQAAAFQQEKLELDKKISSLIVQNRSKNNENRTESINGQTKEDLQNVTKKNSTSGDVAVKSIELQSDKKLSSSPPVGLRTTAVSQSGKDLPLPEPIKQVPLRTIRKAFSKATGIHGVFTPKQVKIIPKPPSPGGKSPPKRQNASKVEARPPKGKLPPPLKEINKY